MKMRIEHWQMRIRIEHILVDSEFNCRGGFTPTSVQELAESMKVQGLINPISVMVNPRPSGPAYMLIAGHRRIAAAQLLGWQTIEAVLHEDMAEKEAHKVNLQENLGRRDLRASHEMRAIVAIYGENPDPDQVARELGKSKKWVKDRLALRDMDVRIIECVDNGFLTALDIQLISGGMPGERWDIAEALLKGKSQGQSSKDVARDLKLRTKTRGTREMAIAKEVLMDFGVSPSWVATLAWCSGKLPSVDFFGLPLEKLEQYGIKP